VTGELWSARPDPAPWCCALGKRAAGWQPCSELDVDRRAIVREVARASDGVEPWLVHPSINALTWPSPEHKYERDVRFITWVAAHARSDIGSVTLDRPSWRWCPCRGAVPLPAGRHELARFAVFEQPETAPGTQTFSKPAIDVNCRSTGFALPRAWSAPDDHGEIEPPLAAMAARELAHALEVFGLRLPQCAAWVTSVTKVIVPLRPDGAEWSSGSQPEIPGLIHLAGLHGPVAALEAVVHESAHHHVTMLQAAGPLVDPCHRDLYPSPLRSDPRPLDRVLLAVHALRHMVSFYDAGLESTALDSGWNERRCHLDRRLQSGLAALRSASPHLTASGRALVAPWLDA
jgi:HEXXH motif-containing protein